MRKIIRIDAIKDEKNVDKKRVCAYARVSTKYDEQKSSLDMQINYYKRYINKNKEWEYVGIYVDKGKSGTSTKNRIGFNKMIKDCEDGRIDLILTKSITRFARNTVDSIVNVRKLKELGLSIYFEKENINTEDEKSEQILTILSSIAQMESENISQNVRWSIKKQFEGGTYKMRNLPYGYKKGENGEIIVDEEKAKIVRKIFIDYMNKIPTSEIVNWLNDSNIKNIQGGIWQNSTIGYIIKNPVYMGKLLLQNTYTTESFPFKILKNNGEKAKYLIEENHEPIIIEQLFKKANKIRQKRGTKGIHHLNRYEFSGIIYCEVCQVLLQAKANYKIIVRNFFTIHSGEKFIRKGTKEKSIMWSCANGLKTVGGCKNRPIKDSELKQIFMDTYNNFIGNKTNRLGKNIQKELKDIEIEDEVENLNKQIHILTKLRLKGYMESAIFISRKDEITTKIEELKLKTRKYKKNDMIKYINKKGIINEYNKKIFISIVKEIHMKKDKSIIFKLKDETELKNNFRKENNNAECNDN